MGGLAFVPGIVKAPGAEEVLPDRSKAATEAVSGKAKVAVFLQGAKDGGGKEAQGILFFLPYGEIFEESCEPEQVYI